MVHINELELAAILADKKVAEKFIGNPEYPQYKDGNDLIDMESEDHIFTDEVQDEWNEWYDYYLDLIESCYEN